MPAGFIRRFTSEPTLAELLSIEGVVILDRDPEASIAGAGAGLVALVAEFENGPFETPLQVAGSGDLATTFGSFGYVYDGVPANNPSARKRLADNTLVPEYWNGNGAIALMGKTFAGLVCCRVDTSVGSVAFSRLASLSGSADFTFPLTTGQTVVVDIGAGNVTSTFTGAVASKTSADGTFPSTFVGGESITFKIDGTTYTAVFLAADQTHTQIVARLNATAGYTAFSESTLKTVLVGRQGGTGGSVQITAVSSALVTTATGFSAGVATAGTGNVANILAVTAAEANTIISTATTAAVAVDRDADGKIRIYKVAAGTIQVDSTSTATAFGWATETTADSASGVDGVIPAGTRVRDGSAVEWVTMQDVAVTAGSAGPYSVKVRPGLDDGSIGGAGVGTVTVIPAPIALGAFAVTNALSLSAALSEAAIDVKYLAALATTKSVGNVGKIVNVVVAARQSNALRNGLRQNVIDASANGCFGRTACIRPPLKTTRAAARSAASQPGVGAYRHQRIDYCFPGAQVYVPSIALRGTAGGAGFTADGLIDVGSDVWAASLLSQLNPEENPGQATDYLGGILAIEAGNADVQAMSIDDYKLFRAAGIMALRIDGGDKIFQSGVTSVDPVTYPQLKNISRRRTADFIADSLAPRLNGYSKKLATDVRRAGILSEVDSFMSGLLSKDNPANQRIADYSIDGRSGNTLESIALGIFRVILRVRLLSSLDVIELDVTAGESVTIALAA